MEIIRAGIHGNYATMAGYEIEWRIENDDWIIQFKTPKAYVTESGIEVCAATFLTIRAAIPKELGHGDKGTLIEAFNKNVSFVNQEFAKARLDEPFDVMMKM